MLCIKSIRRNSNLKELQIIPGVGKSIARDFWNIGIRTISDLKGKDPEELYLRICADQGSQVDRCILYVCRSSVYFAENKNPEPEKLKWWNWKDEK
ncbi:MAG: helix-hairpin-helix domain-containing protein [Methanosarcinales archaeon]|nr:helix-hairpin-helix domain-containing protein [Methanosarcinales archaeon]